MYLLLDVGNTNISVAFYKQDCIIKIWRLRTDINKTADEYAILLNNLIQSQAINLINLEKIIVSSVVPIITHKIIQLCENNNLTPPFVIKTDLKSNLIIDIKEPDTLGADLFVSAVTARSLYPDMTTIILDMGTATTITVVSNDGKFSGGAITTGFEAMANALFADAALLSQTALITDKKVNALGSNTVDCISSGLLYGYAGMVDNIIDNIIKELAPIQKADIKIITTGGQARHIAKYSNYITEISRDFIFIGMISLYQLNK
jgi:pantothenate kinase, type III